MSTAVLSIFSKVYCLYRYFHGDKFIASFYFLTGKSGIRAVKIMKNYKVPSEHREEEKFPA